MAAEAGLLRTYLSAPKTHYRHQNEHHVPQTHGIFLQINYGDNNIKGIYLLGDYIYIYIYIWSNHS